MDKPRKAAILKDVAIEAGVSIMTVSLVLNGKGRISERTRNRVKECAERLGYRPELHQSALRMSLLRTGRKIPFKTIGLVWCNHENSLNDISFFREMFDGMLSEAWNLGLSVMLLNLNFDDRLMVSKLGQIDGLICPIIKEELIEVLHSISHPAITVMSPYPNVPDVGIDDFQAGKMAAEHLIKRGHRRLAFVGPFLNSPVAMRRLTGFQMALREHGLPENREWQICELHDYYENQGEVSFRKMIEIPEKPTGVVFYNDAMALGALRAASARGVRIPDDFSFIGIDGIPETKTSLPPVTTVDIGLRRLGAESVRYLHRIIEDDKNQPASIVLPPAGIREGGSVLTL
ncbi:LacI family DNA-binding transcriptional regulator [Oscillatoria laete-virens NRMC-F 0139]|nr:LacI family DNA-binding transcriptional regulator [Oscillatoria laete-virens]MDL5055071.1 LacI family DNA-binding transcriptional regulator [Oscillatoria laete-virens NRMC-F 0139]